MSQPNPEHIRTSKSPFQQRDGKGVGGTVRIEAPEFTHLDPNSDIPHLASVVISYVPRELILDAEAFGTYLRGFRDYVGKPEESIAMLCEHIAERVEPFSVTIETRWSPRAGVAGSPSAKWIHPGPVGPA